MKKETYINYALNHGLSEEEAEKFADSIISKQNLDEEVDGEILPDAILDELLFMFLLQRDEDED